MTFGTGAAHSNRGEKQREWGQLGTTMDEKITPAKVIGEDNASAVGAGEYFSVALHW